MNEILMNGESFYGISLVIQGHFQDFKVNFKNKI